MNAAIDQGPAVPSGEPRFLAIDAGASKTVAVLADADGVELARVRGPGAHVGRLKGQVWEAIRPSFEMALTGIGKGFVPEALTCCLAIAGAEDRTSLDAARAAAPRFAQLSLVSDGFAGLHGCYGATQPGLMIAVGTGTVAWARTAQGASLKMGGHGFPVGDEGGGAWIGLAVTRHTLRLAETAALDALATAVLARFDGDASRLHRWLTSAGAVDYASLAPLAFEPTLRGGPADAILRTAARELAELADRADPARGLPLALTGGLGAHLQPWLKDAMHRPLRFVADAVVGGALALACGQGAGSDPPALEFGS